MLEYLVRTSQKPRPLPSGRWLMKQRWNDLLFAHWPVPASSLAPLIPKGLQVDSFMGSAWLGVMPFWMDRIKVRGIPPIPGARSFPDLSLRGANWHAGGLLPLAGRQQSVGGGGGAGFLFTAVSLGADAYGAALGEGVFLL
jgi:hypothetical protein